MTIRAFLESVEADLGADKQRRSASRRPGSRKLDRLEVALDDARRRAESGDWGDASGKTFVGLYALCHERLYRVLPEELREASPYAGAARAAGAMLRDRFGGDAGEMAGFVRWVWLREKGRHEWARRESKDRNRLSWMLQFSARLLTDYRAAGGRIGR